MSGKLFKIFCSILCFALLCACSKHEHEWLDATCTEPRKCSICGETWLTELGHDFNFKAGGNISIQPTCQTAGEQVYQCIRCDETQTSVIPAIDHIAGEWQVLEGSAIPTLVTEVRYCAMCGKEMDRKWTASASSGSNSGASEETERINNGSASGSSNDSSGSNSGNGSGSNSGSGSGSNSGGSSGSSSGSNSSNGSAENNFNIYNNVDQQKTTATYVLNTSTKKFHRPSCKDVPKISKKNYSTSSRSKDSLISSGYSPCGHCTP